MGSIPTWNSDNLFSSSFTHCRRSIINIIPPRRCIQCYCIFLSLTGYILSLWSPSLRRSSTNPARPTTSYVGMSQFLFRRAGGGRVAYSVINPKVRLRLTEIIIFIPCKRAEMEGKLAYKLYIIHYPYTPTTQGIRATFHLHFCE